MAESLILVACPHCGCPRSTVIEIRNGFGVTGEQRQCDHCSRTFAHTPTVAYDPVRCRCPNCRAENPKVTKVIQRRGDGEKDLGAVRYHRCERCEYTFKSIEGPR